MKNPNILFFLTDDQRFDTIHALGNAEISTPNIDSLVLQGTTFTHAHIPGGTVAAVCMPSRAMLNCGKTLFNIEDSGSFVPENHALLGETLKENGYQTFGIGKWHQGKRAFSRSFTGGGEIFFGGMSDHWNVPVYNFDPSGEYSSCLKIVKNPDFSNKVFERHCDHVHSGQHSSKIFVDCAIDCIKTREKEKPFYVYLSFLAPHDPRTMPDKFKEMYDPEKISLPENFMKEYPFKFGAEEIRCEKLVAYPRDEAEIRQNIADYYGMISHLDDELGRVIQTLKDEGEYENTIIVFAGDNGLALGQHALMGKHTCYDNSVRVPLIFSGCNIPENKRTAEFAYLSDIFPTLCEMIDCEIPKSVDGTSLVANIINDEKLRDTLYFGYADVTRGVRNRKYKLIEYRHKGMEKTQLFDMKKDPWEINNIIKDPSKKEIVEELSKELIKYSKEWHDNTHPIGKNFWDNY